MTDVLIVEDRTEIAAHLCEAVAKHDQLEQVGLATTLDAGLNALFELKPRIVLVDLGLPDGSGIDLIRACGEADWRVDALVVSIFGDEARVVQAIQAGAKGYILKGGNIKKIADDIVSVLQGGSPISPSIARHLLAIVKQGSEVSEQGEVNSLLTERETEILQGVARGYKRQEIAEQLGISKGTVGNHITSIYRKLEVGSNMEAVARASKIGVI